MRETIVRAVRTTNYDIVTTITFLVLSAVFVLKGREYSGQDRVFPIVIGISTLCILAMILAFQLKNETLVSSAPAEEDDAASGLLENDFVRHSFWILLFLPSIYLFGFVVTIALYGCLFFRINTDLDWKTTVGHTLAMLAFTMIVFVRVLNVPIYEGILLEGVLPLSAVVPF